jgi:hypothetical protein
MTVWSIRPVAVMSLSSGARICGRAKGHGLEDDDMHVKNGPERQRALQEAKQAVRAYVRDPSRANADAVDMAWRKVRQLDGLAEWRRAMTGPSVEGRVPVS